MNTRFLIIAVLLSMGPLFGNTTKAQTQPYDSIDHYILNNKFDRAEQLLRERIGSDSAIAEDFLKLADIFESRLATEQSSQALKNGLELFPEDAGLTYAFAKSLYDLGNIKSALYMMEMARSLDSTHLNTNINLVKLYQVSNRYEDALNILHELVIIDSSNYWYHKQMGNCFVKLSRDSMAVEKYLTALEMNSQDQTLIPVLGNLYIKLRDFKAGINICQLGIQMDSTNTQFRKLKGYLHLLKEEYDSSIYELEQAMELGDSSLFNHKYLGAAYYENNNPSAAVPYLEVAANLDSTDVETSFYLGVSYGHSLEKEKAIPELNRTLFLLEPDSGLRADIYTELAGNYYFRGDYQRVLEYHFKTLEMRPNRKITLFEIGYTFDYGLQEWEKAIIYYQKFLDLLGYVHKDVEEEDPQAQGPIVINLGRTAYLRIQKLKEEIHFRKSP